MGQSVSQYQYVSQFLHQCVSLSQSLFIMFLHLSVPMCQSVPVSNVCACVSELAKTYVSASI